jgi:hypothetical protein
VSVAGGVPRSLPLKPWSPLWGDVAADGRIIYRTSPDAGEIYDPETGQRQPVPDLPGDPLWAPDGRSFAFIIRPGLGDGTDPGLYVQTPAGDRRQIARGWLAGFAWSGVNEVLALEGKPDLKGVLWRVDVRGQRREIVLDPVPLYFTHAYVEVPPVRFDLHPDGRRIVIEALESFEADIGMLVNVR